MEYFVIGAWIMGSIWIFAQFAIFIKPIRDWMVVEFDYTLAGISADFWHNILDGDGLDDDFGLMNFLVAMMGHVAIAFVSGMAGLVGVIAWPIVPFMGFFGLIYLVFIYLPRERAKRPKVETNEFVTHQTNVFGASLIEGNVISNTKPTPKTPKPKIKASPSKIKFKKIKLKK